MKIDPHAWLLTVPATIALIQLYFQPAEHVVKRLWREFTRCEITVWERFGLAIENAEGKKRMRNTVVYASVVAGLAVASLASFGAFVGLVPAS